MVFGMYGSVGSALPHDNPYGQARHPEQTERERRLRARLRTKAPFQGKRLPPLTCAR